MKIVLQVKDSKAGFILDMLKKYPYVKAKTVLTAKNKLHKDIEEAVDELKLVLEGKKEAKNADDFLNEL
jgi:hypothetical protein